jgi:hypothetical protein
MFGSGKKNRLYDEEMEKLIVAIKRVEKPSLSPHQGAAMKARLMRSIRQNRGFDYVPAQVRKLSLRLRLAAARLVLPAQVASALKERIMRAVEAKAQVMSYTSYGRYFRFAISGVLLFVFAFTAVFSAPFRIPVTYANTFLEDISGDVLVWRGGMFMEARKDQALNEGDMVMTLKDSSVTIRFLDHSVGRLGGNTGIEIKRLYSDPINPVLTKVELFLKEGRIWAKVGNLIDEKSVFEVGTEKAVADVPKKGAFDMREENDTTRIAVYDNMVEVKPVNDDGEGVSKTVLAGYQAEIRKDDSVVVALKQIEKNDPDMIASTQWMESNMSKDDHYNTVLAESAAADVLEAEVAVAEQPKVISNADVEAQKVYFLEKYGELIKAEAMFVRGNHKEGSELLRDFMRGLNKIVATLPELQTADAIDATVLKNLIREKMAVQIKDMSAFMPGDRLYPVKEQLQDVELLLAESKVEKMNVRISQAENKLLEIQELLGQDKISYAAALLNDYRNRMDQLVLDLSETGAGELEGVLSDLVKQQVRQVKELTSIESSLADTKYPDFLVQISSLRQERLVKLLDSLVAMKDRIPAEVMLELKDVFDTYLAEANDRDILGPEFDLLFGGEGTGALNFIQPEGTDIPSEVGMVMLVNLEATPEVAAVENAGANPCVNPCAVVPAVQSLTEAGSNTPGGQ